MRTTHITDVISYNLYVTEEYIDAESPEVSSVPPPGLVSSWYFFQRSKDTSELQAAIVWGKDGSGKWLEEREGETA